MIEAPHPADEKERQRALDAYDVLDTDPEVAFDDLTRIASQVCGTPIALVSLIDRDRQWFKSKVGIDAEETPRRIAFCAHAILDPENVFVVDDAAADIRFTDNPLVTLDPKIRFYAGAPLVNPDGKTLGTLCVIDRRPRKLSPQQSETLGALARQVVGQLELRKNYNDLRQLAWGIEASRKELARRNAEINSFYHTLAHELKTPLTAVREFVSIVLDQIAGPITDEQREYLTTSKGCCDQIRTYINDLLDMTRLETGKLPLNRSTSFIGDIVSRVVSTNVPIAEHCELSLRTSVADNLPAVFVDDDRIAQVLTNLIGNAIKFTPPGGEICISARAAEGFVSVEVSDTGMGIEPDHLDRIFDRLYQVREDDAATKGGLGIGLSLCREIVRLHGGSISVKSVPGQGSIFTFNIPVQVGPKEPSLVDAEVMSE